MSKRYLVFSTNVPVNETNDLTSSATWRSGSEGLSELKIDVFDGNETDGESLMNDPRVIAAPDADTVLSLVAPEASNISVDATLKKAGSLRMPQGILAVNAHTSPFTGQGVTVAVLDTGIDAAHPAFSGKQLATRDFTGEGINGDDVSDLSLNGHGTHVAGTICGGVVDDVRVGVAPGVPKLVIGKVLKGPRGEGTLDMFVDAMHWAVRIEKASILSMSLGYNLPGNTKRRIEEFDMDPALAAQQALRDQSEISTAVKTLRAYLEAVSDNVIFLAASGNDSKRPNFVLDTALPAVELFP